MVNLVGSISSNLISADLYSRCTNTALGVYAVAKTKNDTATMDRAIGYAAETCASANDAAGKIDDDLREAIKAAREEEKKKAQEALEKKRAEENNNETNTSESAAAADAGSSDTGESVVAEAATTEVPSLSSYSDNGTVDTAVQPVTTIDIQA
ncbi:MAG TPA: hypothetical protein VHO70_02380 [Chitinispirillaceae bacterium]|nr:hypothetical protein [Chitinispirillaceae bacterium]